MEHTFDTVDEKVAEAEFFLGKMAEIQLDMFGFKCYLSAYLSASRTTTLALQHFKHVPGFEEWYAGQQQRLKADPLAKFILDARNAHVHGGPYPLSGGRFSQGEAQYFFARVPDARYQPAEDVVSCCRQHFVTLLEVVYDCYCELGVHIDPQQYYTKEHFASNGRSIDDAETEVWGWVRTSLIEEGFDEDARWHELRSRVSECKINHLFYSYLGKPTPQPLLPDEYLDFEYGPEDKGWIHTPAGFKSMEEYHRHAGIVIEEL
jgi:hypothetical protein